MQEQLYKEQVATARALADLAQNLTRQQSDEEREANREIFDEELELNRKAAQDRLDLEYGYVNARLELELKALDIIEIKEKQVAEDVALYKQALETPEGGGAGFTAPTRNEGPELVGGRSSAATDLQKAIEGYQKSYQDQKAGLDRIHQSNQKASQASDNNTQAIKENTEALKPKSSGVGPSALPPSVQKLGTYGPTELKAHPVWPPGSQAEAAQRLLEGGGAFGPSGQMMTPSGYGPPKPMTPLSPQAEAAQRLLKGGGAYGPSGQMMEPSGETSVRLPQPETGGDLASKLDAMQKATPNTNYASEKTLLLIAQLLQQVFSTS
jgi:hypothetical protein